MYLTFSTGCHSFHERLAASQEALKNRNVVNLGAIRQGMKRFQFLLNCCEPGTIPDASILAAALDLVSCGVALCVCACVCVCDINPLRPMTAQCHLTTAPIRLCQFTCRVFVTQTSNAQHDLSSGANH